MLSLQPARLTLADGSTFEGQSIGRPGRAYGEVVFNTSMTGYQEILTDPSYKGQIVALTYPLIGNYGFNADDVESAKPQVAGFIVRELCPSPSNWRSAGDMQSFLDRHGIVGIQGIDVRALTRKLRIHGVMMGAISTDETTEEMMARIAASPPYEGIDFARQVTAQSPYQWNEEAPNGGQQSAFPFGARRRVVVIDYGVKFNILRSLHARGCEVIVVPCTLSAEEVLAHEPDGILLSNGPGDPRDLDYAIATVRELTTQRPVMGICLGHQILAAALGARLYKLKFGHRGANHPVKDLSTGRVYITSQNHGYAADAESLSGPVSVSHLNLNDDTVEGLVHRELPVFSIQYHPEASPGPQENGYLFDRFVQMLRDRAPVPATPQPAG